jgi:alkanesulfonate monooxygenase SsuD/methylene tetrahydromethanopterin reductase-like flavin-dependent oxidoreductase (luciferase family)
MVEHHNLVRHRERGAAVALAHVAAGTNTIQIGPGGIGLPQHPYRRSPSSSARSPR